MTNITYKRIAGLVIGTVFLVWALMNMKAIGTIIGIAIGMLFPFILGGTIAFLLNIPMSALEERVFRGRGGKLKRPLCFVVTVVLIVVAIVLVFWLVVPQLISAIGQLTTNIPQELENLRREIQPLLSETPQLEEWVNDLNLEELDFASIGQTIWETGGDMVSGILGAAGSIIGSIASFFMAFIFAGFILMSKERLGSQTKKLMHAYLNDEQYERLMHFFRLAHRTFENFVTGQCMEAVIVALLFFAVLGIGRFDYAPLIAVVLGATSLIPMLGAWLGAIIGAFLLFVSMGLGRTIAFIVVVLIVQQVEGNLIYPRVVGEKVGLPHLDICGRDHRREDCRPVGDALFHPGYQRAI